MLSTSPHRCRWIHIFLGQFPPPRGRSLPPTSDMSFFDLSIPYVDKAGASAPDALNRRDRRLRTVARAMELGYTAVAYDRHFRGVLSDSDRCRIVPFSAQLFLESVSGRSFAAFTASVKLHRDVLEVPRNSSFRQYTRITVSVDSVAAASALNSGNSLLRSYDIVAARPLNQLAFDHACKASDVDIILLDFSQKLPFRLKLAMVQAAVKRGVHFEVCYSHLIADGQAKRQILSEAKQLGEWMRGKNLIISSSATSLNEVRGPYDVANLLTVLLGLTMERAKATICRNCRSLVSSALKKKDCYFKEAIKIERIFSEEKMDSQVEFKDWNAWDPISSGANDLPSLDDISKLFSAASKHSKSQDAIDFTSSTSGMTPNAPVMGLLSCSNMNELDFADGYCLSDEVEQHNNIDHVFLENEAVMVTNVLPNATNAETERCSVEIAMTIDAFENSSDPRTSNSDETQLLLTCLSSDGVCGAGMIKMSGMASKDIEVKDQINLCSVSTQTPRDATNSLNFSFVGYTDQISIVDRGTIASTKEHYLNKTMEREKKVSSLCDAELNGYPDKIDVQEKFVVPLEASISKGTKNVEGQEQLAFQLETSISDDSQVKMSKNLKDSAAADASFSVLWDSSAELQLQESNFIKRNNAKAFPTKTKGKRKCGSTAEISEDAMLSEGLSPVKKISLGYLPENELLLKKSATTNEEQSMQQPVTASGICRDHHKFGKQRRGRKSSHRGYLLTAKPFLMHMLFKKKAGRLRRMHKFL